ncbi:MAG: AI-2E family transporter [Epsilonproteobacteria bacterium]|nr:AI-2E family transporter [Campylobacterota bacterium]
MNNRNFIIALLLFVGYWVVYLYKPFLLDIAVASLLSLATYNANRAILNVVNKKGLASFLSSFLLALIFFIPLIYMINSLLLLLTHLDISVIEKTINYLKTFSLPSYFDFLDPYLERFLEGIDVKSITASLIKFATYIGKESAGFVKDMFLITIFYFFIVYYADDLRDFLKSLIPEKNDKELFGEVSNVMSVVFYSILITAIFEGALFAIIANFMGYNGLLLGILYGLSSLIPFIGGAIMWVPLAAFELSKHNVMGAVIIALYSIIVISIIADTFIKPLIIKYINTKLVDRPSNINEILIFFSIIAGLSTFGFWGMIFGPALTTFFISLVRLYKKIRNPRRRY